MILKKVHADTFQGALLLELNLKALLAQTTGNFCQSMASKISKAS